jgi:DNA-binding response OmpR family regulator
VYGIVKQSGGFLGVESQPGLGTIFRIYLPRVSQPVENPSCVLEHSCPEGGHQTILLVDDDQQLRQLAKKVLTNSGFNVLDAESGEQAARIAELHRGSIHLLLTDVVMPGTSGREIARNICGEGSEPRVLYMSGYPRDIIAHHGVLDPGISLLQKPFSPDALVGKVREVLHAPEGKLAVSGTHSAEAQGLKMA